MDYKFRDTMMNFIKNHREQLSYLFFGVLTTIVNYSSFALLRAVWSDDWIHLINILTFVIATLFAYVTNKIFVFRNRNWQLRSVSKEIFSFFASRASSFLVEVVGLYVCVNILDVGKYVFFSIDGTMAAKILLSFVVVIINYFLSKFFVFRNKKEDGQS